MSIYELLIITITALAILSVCAIITILNVCHRVAHGGSAINDDSVVLGGIVREMREKGGRALGAAGGFLFLGIILLFLPADILAENLIKGYIHNDAVKTCEKSSTKEGDQFTEKQCKYFAEVLSGEYVDDDSSSDSE